MAAGLLSALSGPVTAQEPQITVERHAGGDRVETAASVAAAHFPFADEVLVARADLFADALAAGPLAQQVGAPLLLTDSAALSPATRAEIVRLQPETVTILGGPAAISARVADELAALGGRVIRIAGENRYETSARLFGQRRVPAEVVLASGASAADALAAGGLLPAQVLLTDPVALPPPTDALLRQPSLERVTIVGGPAAVSPAIEAELAGRGLQVSRLAGEDRYVTGVRILEQAVDRPAPGRRPLIVATGADYPDALAGGALAGQIDAAILLVPPGGVTALIADALRLRAGRFDRLEVLGGEQALPAPVVEQVLSAARGETVCDPAYPDHCIPPPPPDLNCDAAVLGGRAGFRVLVPDPHELDADDDGIGCEVDPPPGLTSDSPVSALGIGPVRVGMTVPEAEQAARTPLVVEQPFGNDCYYATPADPALHGIYFVVTGDTVATVNVYDAANAATTGGIRIGSSEADVYDAYAGQVTRHDHAYEPGAYYLIVESDDPALADHGLTFETDGSAAQLVTRYRAGRFPEAVYIEGCA